MPGAAPRTADETLRQRVAQLFRRRRQRFDRELRLADVEIGLDLVQFVYGIAMVLGFTSALGPAYRLVFPPTRPAHLSGHNLVVLVCLLAIVLVGLRFFWVPRNLYSYLLQSTHRDSDALLRRATRFHVPVILAHALVFYVLCQAFADLATGFRFTSHLAFGLCSRFVFLYALLLILNAAWLLRMTPIPLANILPRRGAGSLEAQAHEAIAQTAEVEVPVADPGAGAPEAEAAAEWIWGVNNALFAVLALLLLILFRIWKFSSVVFLLAACTLFLLNGILDLVYASEDYVVFPTDRRGDAA